MIKIQHAQPLWLVRKQASNDDSMMYGRRDDSSSAKATLLRYYNKTGNGPEEFVALDSPFRCPLPKERIGFTALERPELPYLCGESGVAEDFGVTVKPIAYNGGTYSQKIIK